MLIIGGCELALEKNPYSSIETIIYSDGKITIQRFVKDCLIPVRSPMAYMDEEK